MPVVRSGHHDRIDVLLVQNLAVILKQSRRTSGFASRKGKIGVIDVCNGNDLRVGMGDKSVEDLVASIADANESDTYAVVGAENPLRGSGGP